MKARRAGTADIIADGAKSEPVVSYSWTADGEPERCRIDGRDYAGEIEHT